MQRTSALLVMVHGVCGCFFVLEGMHKLTSSKISSMTDGNGFLFPPKGKFDLANLMAFCANVFGSLVLCVSLNHNAKSYFFSCLCWDLTAVAGIAAKRFSSLTTPWAALELIQMLNNLYC
jgi:hypothetical protein